MKRFPSLLLFMAACACLHAAEPQKPIEALRLPDGRVLRNATITAHRALDVTIKHAGGVAAVRYEALPEEVRVIAEKNRPGGPRYLPGETAAKKQTLAGQVFITTQGAGAYKFSEVTVYAFDIEHIERWKHTNVDPVELPRPIASAKTDADGRFKINVPQGDAFFLFAQASRLIFGEVERFEWRVPMNEIKKPTDVQLGAEWRHKYRPVKIEETP